jgi:predicted ester cyclase
MAATAEQYVAIIKNFIQSIWTQKDVEKLDEFMNENVVMHTPLGEFRGLKAVKNFVSKFLEAFSGIRGEVIDTVIQNNKFSGRWKITGTCEKSFFGITVKKQNVSYGGITLFYFANGKIQEGWAYPDLYTLFTQLKAIPDVIKKEK